MELHAGVDADLSDGLVFAVGLAVGRSVVMASKVSATAMIAAVIGMASPFNPAGITLAS